MHRSLTTAVASLTTMAVTASNAVFPIAPDRAVSIPVPDDRRRVAQIAHVGYIHQHRRNSGPFDNRICPIPATARTPTETKE